MKGAWNLTSADDAKERKSGAEFDLGKSRMRQGSKEGERHASRWKAKEHRI